tara:strand:- start:830 stop:1522 length:693 start_codon:yes stop_codon:yes gene_type:complete
MNICKYLFFVIFIPYIIGFNIIHNPIQNIKFPPTVSVLKLETCNRKDIFYTGKPLNVSCSKHYIGRLNTTKYLSRVLLGLKSNVPLDKNIVSQCKRVFEKNRAFAPLYLDAMFIYKLYRNKLPMLNYNEMNIIKQIAESTTDKSKQCHLNGNGNMAELCKKHINIASTGNSDILINTKGRILIDLNSKSKYLSLRKIQSMAKRYIYENHNETITHLNKINADIDNIKKFD